MARIAAAQSAYVSATNPSTYDGAPYATFAAAVAAAEATKAAAIAASTLQRQSDYASIAVAQANTTGNYDSVASATVDAARFVGGAQADVVQTF